MDILTAFTNRYHTPPSILVRAPGRVNLLGEHVDYNDGVVLPAAIDRAVRLAAAPTTDGVVHLYALDLNKQAAFRLDALAQRSGLDGTPLPHWAAYPAGVAWALAEAGMPVGGMQVVYTSDVPIGAGLSSSAAVEVAFAAAWRALGGWEMDNLRLAQVCQRAENGYVGVNSGLMDQFASACGVEGHALYFDTRSLEWHPVALPPGTAIVVADSGMRRTLATSAYNDRRAACEQAVACLQQYKPGLRSLRDITTVEFAAYSEYLPEEVRRRAEHVVKEIHRVEQAVNALRGGDARLFGGLMFAGHKSLRDLYQVSLPELDVLVEIARGLPGIYGARLTGAGFGGCTVNLIDGSQAEAFILGLQDGYRRQTEKTATVYLCHASAGVSAEGCRA
jgi:galactokinase